MSNTVASHDVHKNKPLHNTDANVNQTNVIILHVHPHIVGLSCTCHLDAVQI